MRPAPQAPRPPAGATRPPAGLRRVLLHDRLFETSVAASIALHSLLWVSWRRPPQRQPWDIPAVNVDLSTPFRPRRPGDTRAPGRAKGLPAPSPVKVSGGQAQPAVLPAKAQPVITAPQVPAAVPGGEPFREPAQATPNAAPKEWVLPGPDTKVLLPPAIPGPAAGPAGPVGAEPGGKGTGGEGGRGGSGGGDGTGDAIVNRPPRLINADEIRAMLRRFYPDSERAAGREGQVVVAILVGADGKVGQADVLQSGGAAFDRAAHAVARRMLFEPALVKSVPSAARVKQRLTFRLTD